MRERYDLTCNSDYCKVMEHFGGEVYLKEKFPMIYKAFQNSRVQEKSMLKQNGENGKAAVGRQDIRAVNFMNSVKNNADGEESPVLMMRNHYSYVNKKSAVMIDYSIKDEDGKSYGGDTYVDGEGYANTYDEALEGIFSDKSYKLHGESVFTGFKQNEKGEIIVDTCEKIKDDTEVYINQGKTVVESVQVIDPKNKYPEKISQTYIVYGNRGDNNVSYNYKNVPDPEIIGGVKYANIWCPFKVKIKLNGYTFFSEEPLSNVDFSVTLESQEPNKYGGGGVSYNNTFENIKTRLSDNDTVLEIEIPVDWYAKLTVNEINLVIGAFKFRASFKINYNVEIGGQVIHRMSNILAATDVAATNSSVYVEPIKIRWGCFGKKSVFRKLSDGQVIDVNAEDIEEGDEILTADGDFVRVENIIKGYEEKIVNIQTENNILQLTQTHGIRTERGLVTAGELCFEDKILLEDGSFEPLCYLAIDDYNDAVYGIETEKPVLLVAGGMVVSGKDAPCRDNLAEEKTPKLPEEFMEELKVWANDRKTDKNGREKE